MNEMGKATHAHVNKITADNRLRAICRIFTVKINKYRCDRSNHGLVQALICRQRNGDDILVGRKQIVTDISRTANDSYCPATIF